MKPDRMIRRFVSRNVGREVNEEQAVELLTATATNLATEFSGLNARLLDNIIWKHESRGGQRT